MKLQDVFQINHVFAKLMLVGAQTHKGKIMLTQSHKTQPRSWVMLSNDDSTLEFGTKNPRLYIYWTGLKWK